jgi:hypothetical protein
MSRELLFGVPHIRLLCTGLTRASILSEREVSCKPKVESSILSTGVIFYRHFL